MIKGNNMYYYSLQINTNSSFMAEKVFEIMDVKNAIVDKHIWEYVLKEDINDEHIDFVDQFSTLLKVKNEQLEKNNISKDMISIWFNYEYDKQCNIEFNANELKVLGELGISFCISCWEK